MRWFLLLLCAVLVSAAELENTNVSSPQAAPVYAEHSPFATSVNVRNPHDRAVRIERLDASCSCMQLEIGEHFILPHQSTTLTVSVDNRKRSGPQRMGVTVYLTDPDLESIDVQLWWTVTPDVTVDALAPRAETTLGRPADIAWRDIYKFVANERPDELQRLSKRMLLTSPQADFTVLGIDYTGPLWSFTPLKQSDGSWLITASAKDPQAQLPEKLYDETVTIRTNHAHKSEIAVQFVVNLTRKAGSTDFDRNAIPPPPPLK
jgi:hypothetical protein